MNIGFHGMSRISIADKPAGKERYFSRRLKARASPI
jgi:hypothetical protein